MAAVQPVPRALSFGGYCFNGLHMQGLKSNCELRVIQGDPVLFLYQGTTKIAAYVAGTPDGNLASLNKAIAAAKPLGLPVAAYWPRSLQSGALPTGADIVAVEAYQQEATLAAWETRVRASLKRCPTSWLIAQCYTSNDTLTKNLEALVAPYSDFMNDFLSIHACLLFSGAGRPTGLQDHPEVLPLWKVVADSVKTPPLPMEPPVPIPDHKNVVVAARAKYNAMPAGVARGGTITNQVAWDLRAEGAGTYYKPSGDNYKQRSIDVIIYKTQPGDPAGKGQTFDILGDAEGAAKPQWSRTQPTGYGDIGLWRAPVQPEIPPDPTEPPSTDLKAVLRDVRSDLVEIKMQAEEIQTECDTSIAKIDAALD